MTRPDTSTSAAKTWMVISWQRNDLMDGAYGLLLTTVEGTYEEAAEEARGWVRLHGPVGVVGEIK